MSRPQNTTHAVMAQRNPEDVNAPDDFPTPPWAVRALVEHVIGKDHVKDLSCLEPACGRGYMAATLSGYFANVEASDAFDYGYGEVSNFLTCPTWPFDWIITNPPFRLAEEFILRAHEMACVGVAMLVRTSFIESVGRHRRLFKPYPPALVAQFTERVPMIRGRLDGRATTATSYCWIVWRKAETNQTGAKQTLLTWIPKCRKRFERPGDYDNDFIFRPQPEGVDPGHTGSLLEG
jgi:hypothetical protein